MPQLGLGLGLHRANRALFRGLLDQYAGAAAAYSLRALSSGWLAGDVVEVRRSSDSTTQGFTANQITNGDLLTFCGVGDGFVSTWYDQSGNANNATQITTTAQPKIVSAGALVTGGIDFDGVDDMLDISAVAASQPITTFTTYKATASNSVPFGTDVTATISAGRRFNDEYVLFAGTVISSGVHPSTEVLSSVLFSGASSAAWWNGASLLSGNAGTNGGIDSIGASGASRMTGTIAELIIYPSDESANRAAIEANINAYYSIYA